jgi:hypothetical protein
MNITKTIAWDAIKEAVLIIEKTPILEVHLQQLMIIKKYTEELKRSVEYGIRQGNSPNCCGG